MKERQGIKKYLPNFLLPLEEQEVVPGVTFGEVKEAATQVGPQETPRGILNGVDQKAWGVLIGVQKERIGMKAGRVIDREEVLTSLAKVYASRSAVTTDDYEILGVIEGIKGKAMETAREHKQAFLKSY